MERIMFNDRFGLTDAVIEKRKTVTRRLVKPPQWSKGIIIDSCGKLVAYGDDEDVDYINPPYKVGEIVAVAQSYATIAEDHQDVDYFLAQVGNSLGIDDFDGAGWFGWKNKMFVKADLMPHQIRILDVRAERLQDITEEDCLAEGVQYVGAFGTFYFECKERDEGFYFSNTHEAYASLIDKISGKGTWNANPWVWRIEFELIK